VATPTTSTTKSATSGEATPPCSICNRHAAIPAVPSAAAIIPTPTVAFIPTISSAATSVAAGVLTSMKTGYRLGSVLESKLRETSTTTFGAGVFGRREWDCRGDRLAGRLMRSFVRVGLGTCRL